MATLDPDKITADRARAYAAFKQRMATDPAYAAHVVALRAAWRKANPGATNRISKDWRRRNPEKAAAQTRRYRERHPEKTREIRASWLARHPTYAVDRRKKPTGRVCLSCGESDSKKLWSVSWKDYCNTCHCRAKKNGLCDCGEARYKDGCRGCVGEVSHVLTGLWDLHCFADAPGEIKWSALARVRGLDEKAAKREIYRVFKAFAKHDCGATWVGGSAGHVESKITYDVRRFQALFEGTA